MGAFAGNERGPLFEPPYEGNGFCAAASWVPDTRADPLALWASSEWVNGTVGQQVQDHCARMARIEVQAFGRHVTDRERHRGLERLQPRRGEPRPTRRPASLAVRHPRRGGPTR